MSCLRRLLYSSGFQRRHKYADPLNAPQVPGRGTGRLTRRRALRGWGGLATLVGDPVHAQILSLLRSRTARRRARMGASALSRRGRSPPQRRGECSPSGPCSDLSMTQQLLIVPVLPYLACCLAAGCVFVVDACYYSAQPGSPWRARATSRPTTTLSHPSSLCSSPHPAPPHPRTPPPHLWNIANTVVTGTASCVCDEFDRARGVLDFMASQVAAKRLERAQHRALELASASLGHQGAARAGAGKTQGGRKGRGR